MVWAPRRYAKRRHQEGGRNALAGHVADGDTQLRLREKNEVVIVTTNAEGGTAGARVVESRDWRVFLGKQPLLHVARDFDVARLLRARGHFGRDRRHQPAVLERQARLRRDGIKQTNVGSRKRFLGLLGAEADDAQQLLVEGQRQEELRFQLL